MNKFTPEEQPAIRLSHFNVSRLNLDVKNEHWDNQDITNHTSYSLRFSAFNKSSDKSYFGLLFEVALQNEDKSFNVEISFVAHFDTVGVTLDPAFFEGHYIKGNAPAIVFPYIRAYITNLLQNSGYNPVILPAFNFNDVKPVKE